MTCCVVVNCLLDIVVMLTDSQFGLLILQGQSLQNDLLCGQGDVESTKPTKMLMKIAEYVDSTGESWFTLLW